MRRKIQSTIIVILTIATTLTANSAVATDWRPKSSTNALTGRVHRHVDHAPDTQYQVALKLLIEGNLEAAKAKLLDLLSANPYDTRILLTLAIIASQHGDEATAAHLRKRAFTANPLDGETIAAYLPRSTPGTTAMSGIKTAQAATPDVAALHFALGVLLANEFQWSGAREQFRIAVALDPGNPDTHFNLGICLEHDGESSGAIRHYQSALEARRTRPALFPSDQAHQRRRALALPVAKGD